MFPTAHSDTDDASNGRAEAVNGSIAPGRRAARGFRNSKHYRLRMLLITGGLDASAHTQL
ncbi:transposase [Brevibacterium album]|uniref:transposase n=1 Tax=Brevibacterium album TaxID=417948 RepID=UPI001FE1AF17|nr:transposase [Brevibacterium album]